MEASSGPEGTALRRMARCTRGSMMVSRPGVGECSRHYEKERQEKWPKVKEIVTKSLLFQVLKAFIFNLCVCMFVPCVYVHRVQCP